MYTNNKFDCISDWIEQNKVPIGGSNSLKILQGISGALTILQNLIVLVNCCRDVRSVSILLYYAKPGLNPIELRCINWMVILECSPQDRSHTGG